MKVKELADLLSKFDPETDVGIVYDGCDRMNVDRVWLSRYGRVLFGGEDSVVYDTEDRPADAPTKEEERYWNTDRLVPDEELS